MTDKTAALTQHTVAKHKRLPEWLKVKARTSDEYNHVHRTLKQHGLHSVCQEASCPNIRECFGEGTATFIILGDRCTRNCRFCAITPGCPDGLDTGEPARLAEVVSKLKLKQVVITSVTRDDLPDGGAAIFAATMRELRARDRSVRVEFLIPDLRGDEKSIATVIDSGVDVLAHNVETVGRLYSHVRPGSILKRSLGVLRFISDYQHRPAVKTGFMVGLGETQAEIVELLEQIKETGTDIVTIGQYLRPSMHHLDVERFYTPEEFTQLAELATEIGFLHCESGPLVRSSYHAFKQSEKILAGR